MKVLLVDPSDRGGIALNTDSVASRLMAAGERPELLTSRSLAWERPYPVWRWLARVRWGGQAPSWRFLHARRLAEWCASAPATEAAVRLRRPHVVDFQAPLNRRWDARLVRRLARLAPVVWTVHDVLPPDERTEANRRRYAAIYRAATLLIVHSELAREQVRELGGAEPAMLGLAAPAGMERVGRDEARRRLGLPEDGRLLAALGFIRPYKGYELLADVWERLGPAAPRLLVMGEVADEAETATLERLRNTGRAELRLGYASDEELNLGFCAADAVLLPHLDASESGLLATARALRVPVIASDVPELARSVEATGASSIVPRDVARWAAAVSGDLPAPPATSLPLDTGPARREVYETARRRWLERRGGRTSPGGRIRLAAYTDSSQQAGAELSLATLLKGLRSDIEVTVMGSEKSVVEALAAARPGSRTALVPAVRNKRDLRPILAHLRAVRRLSPHIFHANLRIPWSCQYGIAAAVMARRTRVVAVEQLYVPPASSSQRRLKRLASLALDAHVAVGDRLAREIEAETGLPAGLIRSIHNTIEPNASGPAQPARRPVDGPLVGTLARLAPEKALHLLIEAVAELPGVTAVLVGDGPERGALERLSQRIGVDDRVRFEGWVADPSAWLGTFDVFVLPSRYEGLPHAVLEAMLAERPVVATDVGSVREAVDDGMTGLLVPPDDAGALSDAIRRLLDDRQLARRLAAAGRAAVLERFRPEQMVSAYESLYDEVLG
jgi:glycosyltransferase involved in cell wall biosynthesis